MNFLQDILVIDDEPAYGEIIADIARLNKVATTYIASCDELTRELSMAHEAIFLDLHMPEKDGIEVLRKLHQFMYQGMVVIMTGFDKMVLESAKQLAVEFGLDIINTLSKPFEFNDINQLLTQMRTARIARTHSIIHKVHDEPKRNTHIDKNWLLNHFATGNVEMHYQPKINIQQLKISGYEALLRIREAEDKLIYPGDFMYLCDNDPQVADLMSQAVIKQVLQDVAAQAALFEHTPVAINLSPVNLHNLDFPDWLASQCDMAGVLPAMIKIEITENAELVNLRQDLDILIRLRLKGFHLAIDDFGTGKAVMANLIAFPFTELKIDRIFIDNMHENDNSIYLVENTIKMAHSLDLTVVAEGVEHANIVNMLHGMGVDEVQGYYYARPTPLLNLPPVIADCQAKVFNMGSY